MIRQLTAQPPITNPIHQDEINAILWKACDTFRGTIDPSEYKNCILVMFFVKYVSDVGFDPREQYERELCDPERVERRLSREQWGLEQRKYTPSAVLFYYEFL